MNRVVITGMGAVTPIGNNVEDFWQNSKNGNSGIDFIKSMDTSDLEVKVGGEVKDLKLEDYLDKKEIRRLDRFTQYALIASEEAIKNSNLDLENIDSDRFGVMVGSGIGGFHTHQSEFGNINFCKYVSYIVRDNVVVRFHFVQNTDKRFYIRHFDSHTFTTRLF